MQQHFSSGDFVKHLLANFIKERQKSNNTRNWICRSILQIQFVDILREWKVPKLHEFEEESNHAIKCEVRKLIKHGEEIGLRSNLSEQLHQYRKTVVTQAKNLAKEIGDNSSEADLLREFDSNWLLWIQELRKPCSNNTVASRRACAVNVLYSHFYKYKDLVEREVKLSPLTGCKNVLRGGMD